jgi:serine/threonine-protein phosphatase 2A regulatory subunit B
MLTFFPPIVDKTVKLWKVYEKSIKVVAENNLNDGNGVLPRSPPAGLLGTTAFNNGTISSSTAPLHIPHFTPQTLRLPRMTHHETIVTATPRRIFQNAHAYHINSVSVNSDAETFISADDLRINLWNLNIPDQSFSTLNPCPASSPDNVCGSWKLIGRYCRYKTG